MWALSSEIEEGRFNTGKLFHMQRDNRWEMFDSEVQSHSQTRERVCMVQRRQTWSCGRQRCKNHNFVSSKVCLMDKVTMDTRFSIWSWSGLAPPPLHLVTYLGLHADILKLWNYKCKITRNHNICSSGGTFEVKVLCQRLYKKELSLGRYNWKSS